MDKDGNMIIEPMKETLYPNALAYERENAYILGCDGKTFIIDKETGRVKEKYLYSYDEESGLAIDGTASKLFSVDKGDIISLYK